MKIYLLIALMFVGGCLGDMSSKCTITPGIKWYDIQAVFDALDPCTPNPCSKGHVCRVNEETYQHYCEACKVKNGTKGNETCVHASSFENLLLMFYSGFYRALPLLRQMPSERLNICPNVNGHKSLGIQEGGGGKEPGSTTIENKELCKPNPCQNGGKCFSNVESQDYYCVCPNRNSGKSCEEIVFSEENRITVGFKATQMNDYGAPYVAKQAIDDIPTTFTATGPRGNKPWWQIDFGHLYRVVGVTVVNRHDCCPERLHDFEVRVGNKSMSSTNTQLSPNVLCHFHRDAGIPVRGSVDMYCKPDSIVGRYLTIQIVENCVNHKQPHCASEGDILTLAEVRVYGYPYRFTL